MRNIHLSDNIYFNFVSMLQNDIFMVSQAESSWQEINLSIIIPDAYLMHNRI